MTTSTTMGRLIEASHTALAGTNPQDTWRAYGLELATAVAFVEGWVDELRGRAKEADFDPDDPGFAYQLAFGMLAVGIEYGKANL